MECENDRLDRDDRSGRSVFARLRLLLIRVDRILLSWARAKWFHVLGAGFLACVIMTAALDVTSRGYGGDLFKGEGLVVLPIGVVALLSNHLRNIVRRLRGSQNWSTLCGLIVFSWG
jgi:hypothetical protein